VPIDFSRGSDKAFDYAMKLAREKRAKLIALHVVPAEMIYPAMSDRFDFHGFRGYHRAPGEAATRFDDHHGKPRPDRLATFFVGERG
jgi:nucleotide-binding universal stress UspA family protein